MLAKACVLKEPDNSGSRCHSDIYHILVLLFHRASEIFIGSLDVEMKKFHFCMFFLNTTVIKVHEFLLAKSYVYFGKGLL